MSAQLELAFGDVVPPRPETSQESALRSTHGRGYWTKREALDLMYARVAARVAAGDWPPGRNPQ